VIGENRRVLEAVAALKQGRLERLGQLMNASHVSLRVDYEVSSAELDELVWAAWSVEDTLGSRLTGAGFGGCTVTLARQNAVAELTQRLEEKYYRPRAIAPRVYPCRPSPGAEFRELD